MTSLPPVPVIAEGQKAACRGREEGNANKRDQRRLPGLSCNRDIILDPCLTAFLFAEEFDADPTKHRVFGKGGAEQNIAVNKKGKTIAQESWYSHGGSVRDSRRADL